MPKVADRARDLIATHGDVAHLEAKTRAAYCRESGDIAGAVFWLKVCAAIRLLRDPSQASERDSARKPTQPQ